MNKELIDTLRLDVGIARLTDWDQAIIYVDREGNAADPIEGLALFAELIVRECVRITVENVGEAERVPIEKLYDHFGMKK